MPTAQLHSRREAADARAVRRYRRMFRSSDARRRIIAWDPWHLDGASGVCAVMGAWVPGDLGDRSHAAASVSHSHAPPQTAVPAGTWYGTQDDDDGSE